MVRIVKVINRSGYVAYAIQETKKRWFFTTIRYLDIQDARCGVYRWHPNPVEFNSYHVSTDLKEVFKILKLLDIPLWEVQPVTISELEKVIYES